jgi:hypothetical protein
MMTTKGKCGVCGGEIEFDSEFSGTETECPLCQGATVLVPKPGFNFRKWLPLLIKISLGLAPAAILVLAVRWFHNLKPDAQEFIVGSIGGAVGGIAVCVIGLCLLYLLVLWLVFPWMVLAKLNELIREVKRARRSGL